MAGLLGAVGPFERDTDDWTAYCERLQQFFVANEIKEDGKKRAVLLSVCGTASYQLIRSLVAPSKPTDKSVDEIMKLVKECRFLSLWIRRDNCLEDGTPFHTNHHKRILRGSIGYEYKFSIKGDS